jgi:hypothetical protein
MLKKQYIKKLKKMDMTFLWLKVYERIIIVGSVQGKQNEDQLNKILLDEVWRLKILRLILTIVVPVEYQVHNQMSSLWKLLQPVRAWRCISKTRLCNP